jgi:excisionase family DNA binding protein
VEEVEDVSNGPLFVSVREASRLLGVGRTTTYALIESGVLRSVTFCSRRLVPVVAIKELDPGRRADVGELNGMAWASTTVPSTSVASPARQYRGRATHRAELVP